MSQTMPAFRPEEGPAAPPDAAPGMVPVAIGACFAAYHWAPGSAVLILPSLGYEAAATARVWRDLSLRLAERGMASLRPDLPGTGDSAGRSDDAGHVAAWRGAVRDCAEWLAARHGGPIAVLGCRFGALLALDAVSGGLEADRLVLLEPPSSGKAFARELRLRSGVVGQDDAPRADGLLDADGLVLGESDLAAIAGMPRPIPPGRRLPETLVFSHRARDLDRGWQGQFRAAGMGIAVEDFEGYEEFLLRSLVDMKPPEAVLARVVEVLEPRPFEPPPPPPRSGLMLPGCAEEPRWFGGRPRRFGVLCRPDRPRAGAPVVVLPSASNLPRSGGNRVLTDLARLLAQDGFASFRFDRAGVGESDGACDSDPVCDSYRPEHIDGVLAAVDALDGWGFGRSVVAGLCSGAYTAWHAAKEDARIAGVLVVNAQHLHRVSTFTRTALATGTAGQHLNGVVKQYLAAPGGLAGAVALRLQRLRRGELRVTSFVRVLAALAGRSAAGAARRAAERIGVGDPAARQVLRHLASLTGRGCAVHFVYTETNGGLAAFHRAFGQPPGLPEGARLTLVDGMDHTFTGQRQKQELAELAAGFARAAAA